jgi:hypothetical protein
MVYTLRRVHTRGSAGEARAADGVALAYSHVPLPPGNKAGRWKNADT